MPYGCCMKISDWIEESKESAVDLTAFCQLASIVSVV